MKKLFALLLIMMVSLVTACSDDAEKAGSEAKNETGKETGKENSKETKQEDSKEKVEKESDDKVKSADSKESDKAMAEGTETKLEEATFTVPSHFMEQEAPKDFPFPIVVYAFKANDAVSSLNVLVEPVPDGVSFDQFLEASFASTGFDYESKKNFELNGQQWNEAVSINLQGFKLNQKTVIHNGNAYIFSYASMPANYEVNMESYDKLIDSVKFTN
ncbi:hypothetical protein [Mesobacillus zeae]|uniref:DUF1795 domain-containing protein n=1 Tax=Mesobacillus zeae TaxID=1917180 RepID=A0A398BGX3_9BACI|nr:hypothetical protein [Mesobacillus zeae]RID86816.1 hypothetical protein D1970_06055 [Mesobacillus zeae]